MLVVPARLASQRLSEEKADKKAREEPQYKMNVGRSRRFYENARVEALGMSDVCVHAARLGLPTTSQPLRAALQDAEIATHVAAQAEQARLLEAAPGSTGPKELLSETFQTN